MNWDVKSEWAPWTFTDNVGTQVGGFKVLFSNPRSKTGNGLFQFATVHGAGHMVPSTRSFQGFTLVKDFITATAE